MPQKEQVQDWLAEPGKSSEQVRELLIALASTDGRFPRSILRREGFSREAFSAWLARGHWEDGTKKTIRAYRCQFRQRDRAGGGVQRYHGLA